jgi:hypothetical protein
MSPRSWARTWGFFAVAWGVAFVTNVECLAFAPLSRSNIIAATVLGALASFVGFLVSLTSALRNQLSAEREANTSEIRAASERGIAEPARWFPDSGPDSVARELLMRLLTLDQQQEYRANRSFLVKTARARYYLRECDTVGVSLPEFSITVCVVFDREVLPDADRLIAILLMIRTEEELFLQRFVWPAKRRVEASLEHMARMPQATTVCIQSSADLLPSRRVWQPRPFDPIPSVIPPPERHWR